MDDVIYNRNRLPWSPIFFPHLAHAHKRAAQSVSIQSAAADDDDIIARHHNILQQPQPIFYVFLRQPVLLTRIIEIAHRTSHASPRKLNWKINVYRRPAVSTVVRTYNKVNVVKLWFFFPPLHALAVRQYCKLIM